jgi:lipoate-protein ligase A
MSLVLLNRTLATPAENVALDEAILQAAELGDGPSEVLRLWQSTQTAVVLGRSSIIENEVDRAACLAGDVPVIRRRSGGAAVVVGPGCLCYAITLSLNDRPQLRDVAAAHRFVAELWRAVLGRHVGGVHCKGTSDLAIGEQKFSGNAMRVARDHVLYHGTLLLDFPIEQIARLLLMPSRTPDYRQGRSHAAFLTNLPLEPTLVCALAAEAFDANHEMSADDASRSYDALVARLVAERYSRSEWTERR